MLLSARTLIDVASVNSFEASDHASWTAGDAVTLYIQLIDASVDTSMQGYYPSGRRYMPPATSTLTVQIQNIDTAKQISRLATQPFPEDASIWQVTILSTDLIQGSPQMLLTLTEPGRTIKGLVKNAIKIYPSSNAGC